MCFNQNSFDKTCILQGCLIGDKTKHICTNILLIPKSVTFLCSDLHLGCSSKVDVSFMIDLSGSIQRRNAFKVLDFVNAVISRLRVHRDETRVGAVVFNDRAKEVFPLNEYSETGEVMEAVSMIQYTGGQTNIADALRFVQVT